MNELLVLTLKLVKELRIMADERALLEMRWRNKLGALEGELYEMLNKVLDDAAPEVEAKPKKEVGSDDSW